MIYTCASCTIHACVSGDKEKMPANCPMRNTELMERAKAEYLTEANKDFYVNSCLVESEGYCQWPRVREIVEFVRFKLCKCCTYASTVSVSTSSGDVIFSPSK